MTVIFALPRTDYGSYADLYSLIDLSGFDKCYIDEIQSGSDNAYIITIRNGELGEGWAGARARIVLWDMEWRREPLPPISGISDYWHIDKWQAEMLGQKYVPIGGHPGLRLTDTPTAPQYDVAYMGYMTYRRQVIHAQLLGRVTLSPTSAWGDERNAILNASRAYLHVHQHDDIPAVPGLRLVVAAAYKLPFFTEECADAGVFYGHMHQQHYERLADDLRQCLYLEKWDEGVIASLGEHLHDFLCHDLTFRKSVEAAL